MKIALGQINIVQAQPQKNFETMKEMVTSAKVQGADLIVFPQLSLTGYFLMDLWKKQEWIDYCLGFNEKICELSDGIGICYGNIVRCDTDHRTLSNAVYFCQNRKWVKKENAMLDGISVQHLTLNDRIFDDSRYFTASQTEPAVFLFEHEGKTVRIGTGTANELTCADSSLLKYYTEKRTDYVIECSGMPWNVSCRPYESVSSAGIPVIHVSSCGMQNNGKNVFVYDGASCIYDGEGQCCYGLNDEFKEQLAVVDMDVNDRPQGCSSKLMKALCCAIRNFDSQMFSPKMKWIVGLSGGLDSSITSSLLVYTLGADRVVGYNMASRYNSLTTKNNAAQLAERLGMKIREGSIEKIVDSTVDTLMDYGYEEAQGLALENIQARIRGHLLSSFAAAEGGVIVNNGNKVEAALGYCTLYGDAIGALSPIADCTKVQLFELARQINEAFGREVIPANLLPVVYEDHVDWEFPPSAELKDNQQDPMKWFYHDWLISTLMEQGEHGPERIMKMYLDGSLQKGKMGRWICHYGLDDPEAFITDLEWVVRTMQFASFKRIQFPPIITISTGAFGTDVREAQIKAEKTEEYGRLREAVLAMK